MCSLLKTQLFGDFFVFFSSPRSLRLRGRSATETVARKEERLRLPPESVGKNFAKDVLSINMAQCGLDSLQIKLGEGRKKRKKRKP